MDPSRGMDRLNENKAVLIAEKRKLQASPQAEGTHTTGKRMQLGWGSAGPEFCDDQLLLLVLRAADTKTLLRCLALSTSWNSLIRSSGFRHLWAGQGETWVLLSSLWLRDCDFWIPGSKVVSPFKLLPEFYKVVASAGGLVCIQRGSHDPYLSLWYDRSLAVGNPITDEWVHLPLPQRARGHLLLLWFRCVEGGGGDEEATRRLEVVAAARAGEFVEDEEVLKLRVESEVVVIRCNAVGRYACFSVDSTYHHPAMPMILYDLHSGCWASVARPCDHPDHHDSRWLSAAMIDYTSPVLYSPSLLAPGNRRK